MVGIATRTNLLRPRDGRDQSVRMIELFFDLVFVFAITQLSHLLIEHLTLEGAFQTSILLVAVWWAWIYTAWVTNWFDPDQVPIRLLLIAVMLVSLLMSSAIPSAFSDRGLLFAAAYSAIQVGRSIAVRVALGRRNPLAPDFVRITIWSAASAVIWITGGLASESIRTEIWVLALLIDLAGPPLGFRVPGRGRSDTRTWTIDGRHMTERCQLFLILSLGEAILITGATFGSLDPAFTTIVAVGTAFFGSVALWWIYFHATSDEGSVAIAQSDDPGALARSAYTYSHLLLVAAVIVTAVADEVVIAHPQGHVATSTIAVLTGGTGLFLAGHALFVWLVSSRVALASMVAVAVIGFAALIGPWLSPLGLSALCTLVAAAVATAESIQPRTAARLGAGDD